MAKKWLDIRQNCNRRFRCMFMPWDFYLSSGTSRGIQNYQKPSATVLSSQISKSPELLFAGPHCPALVVIGATKSTEETVLDTKVQKYMFQGTLDGLLWLLVH
jgi:hypothetical protein